MVDVQPDDVSAAGSCATSLACDKVGGKDAVLGLTSVASSRGVQIGDSPGKRHTSDGQRAPDNERDTDGE